MDFQAKNLQNSPNNIKLNIQVDIDFSVGSSIDSCEELADVVEAAEMAACRSACEKARAKILAAQTEDLPALKERLPIGVELDSDGPMEGDPEVEEAISLVEAAVGDLTG